MTKFTSFNFYISKFIFFNNLLLYKFFCKYVYLKVLLIGRVFNFFKKKNYIFEDFFNFFNIYFLKKKKKKYKKLGFFKKIKDASFLKCNFFIYKHSKLQIYKLETLSFKTYIKKNFYFSLKLLKTVASSNLLFIYKNVRGGFLCFSNKICGFISLKYLYFLKALKNSIIFYKRYFLFSSASLLSFSIINYKNFLQFNSGFTRNFSKIKNTLRRVFFKRFKFIFQLNSYYFYFFLKIFFLINSLNFFKKKIYYTFFFKLFFLSSTR